jgi:hypothetical protein
MLQKPLLLPSSIPQSSLKIAIQMALLEQVSSPAEKRPQLHSLPVPVLFELLAQASYDILQRCDATRGLLVDLSLCAIKAQTHTRTRARPGGGREGGTFVSKRDNILSCISRPFPNMPFPTPTTISSLISPPPCLRCFLPLLRTEVCSWSPQSSLAMGLCWQS